MISCRIKSMNGKNKYISNNNCNSYFYMNKSSDDDYENIFEIYSPFTLLRIESRLSTKFLVVAEK